jgi:hypothetical protein
VLRAGPHRRARVRSRGAAAAIALAWLAVLATAVTRLEQAGAPPRQVLPYVAAWIVGCALPGVMVWRGLAGHSTIVRELGFGSVLGIVLQLMVWAGATAVHRPVLMLALPLGVLVLFLLVPRLRQHWCPRRPVRMRTPVRWHLAMAVVIALAVYRFERLSGVRRALPPEPSVVNRDTWYNSALSYELSRTLRPQDPFAVGQPLRYHWFADAHITATAQLSGVPIVNAMITLWLVPMLIVLLLVVAAAAQQFMDGPRPDGSAASDVRRWWVGPVAAFFTLVAPALWRFGRPGTERTGDGFVASSPSGILAMVLVLGLAAPMLDLLRGRARRGTWIILTLLLGACVGTKPSILPVVAFGATVVLVADLLRSRRLHRPMAYVIGISTALAVAAARVLTGSTGGSHFQLLALVSIDPSYARLLEDKPVFPAAGGWLVPALAEQLPNAVPVIAMLLVVWMLTETPRLLSLTGIFLRPMRTDPGVLWGCGVVAGGYVAMWALAHPGYSEHYFWTVTIGLSTVLTVTNAARVLPASRRAWTLVPAMIAVAVPGVAAAYATTTFGPVDLDAPARAVIEGRLRPYSLMVASLAVAVLTTVLLRIRARRWALPLLTATTTFCLAASLPVAYLQLQAAQPPRMNPLPKVGVSYPYVSPEQQRAALWLQRHSASTAVVATNMFCWPMGQRTPGCQINSAWLPGLSGRRMVLSDWTYTSANMSRYDGTRQLNRMPAPWPERRRLSTQAVEQSTPQLLAQLRRDYDARWIFADTRATKVSPRLKTLAALRYTSAHIRIFRLHDSYAP